MSGYNNFLLRMNAGGTTMRDEQVENAKKIVHKTFADDPSYIPEGVPIWYSDRILHPRIYGYTWKSTMPFQATMQTQIHEPFYLGDIVKWDYGQGWWMCVGVENLHGINWEGKLMFCNFRLKFRSPVTKEVREYPVAMYNATQYGTGEEHARDGKITVGSAAHIIYLMCDEHTLHLDNGARFLIDRNMRLPSAFQLTQMDTSSYASGAEHGYLRLYVLEDQFNPKTDDAEKMLADAFHDEVASGSELAAKPDLWL